MGDLAYETATLQSNFEALDEIQGALHTFDESFSMFLYGLKMNAFCVEWPEVRVCGIAGCHAFGLKDLGSC